MRCWPGSMLPALRSKASPTGSSRSAAISGGAGSARLPDRRSGACAGRLIAAWLCGRLRRAGASGYKRPGQPPGQGRSALDLKRIDDHVSVSGQIRPEDEATLKAMRFVAIVNSRPDGESPDQPAGAEIEAAARAAGLDYHAIPLGREGFNPDLVNRTRAALE